jgi:hypothetical protein
MAKNPYTTDTTTPSLGAIDLAHMMGAGIVIGMGGLETTGPAPKARRSLVSLLRKLTAFRSRAR